MLSPQSDPETIRLLLPQLTIRPHRRLDDRRQLLAGVDVLVHRLLQARVVAVALFQHGAEAIGEACGGHGEGERKRKREGEREREFLLLSFPMIEK